MSKTQNMSSKFIILKFKFDIVFVENMNLITNTRIRENHVKYDVYVVHVCSTTHEYEGLCFIFSKDLMWYALFVILLFIKKL